MIRVTLHRRTESGIRKTAAYITATPEDLAAGRLPGSYYPAQESPGVTVAMVNTAIRDRMANYPDVVAAEMEWRP